VPAQQRSVASQEFVASRQIEPAGLHCSGWLQRPIVAPAALLHVTFVPGPPPTSFVEPGEPFAPQQSVSCWQSSPVGWQPVGGWHTRTPVAANGRHDLLQQLPPHGGSEPPVVAPVQTVPAIVQSPAPAALTVLQRPSAAPAAFVQLPPQQSRAVAQASPFWAQNEGAVQRPSLQRVEQHVPPASPPHGLPVVLHVVLSGVHLPVAHFPPQHSPSVVHAALSAMHCFAPHLPPMHAPLQHSVVAPHAVSGVLQPATGGAHCFVVPSQLRDPQSRLVVQVVPFCPLPPPMVFVLPAASPPPSVAFFAASSPSLPHPLTK
jgi:hypothetical protein